MPGCVGCNGYRRTGIGPDFPDQLICFLGGRRIGDGNRHAIRREPPYDSRPDTPRTACHKCGFAA
jgi:hypothetical protein